MAARASISANTVLYLVLQVEVLKINEKGDGGVPDKNKTDGQAKADAAEGEDDGKTLFFFAT